MRTVTTKVVVKVTFSRNDLQIWPSICHKHLNCVESFVTVFNIFANIFAKLSTYK